MSSPIENLGHKLDCDASPKVAAPVVGSFREFLERHARVKTPDGSYGAYTFEGREALEFVVGIIDRILGNHRDAENAEEETAKRGQVPALQISDARLTATGSAQWGKTILELNLLAYLTGLQFRSVGLFLPDEDLVQGVVDSKFRPDVLDQLPWLNSLITLGKAENASGKTVNRKGLFTVTDGQRKSHGMIHGMQKIPTTFSFDVVIEDEKDDIPPRMSRYLTARMTASDLRFRLSIGTQRYAGAGQNKEFEAGTMHIGYFTCPACGHKQNPEENWPGICRLAIDGTPQTDDPQLQIEGNFRTSEPQRHRAHRDSPPAEGMQGVGSSVSSVSLWSNSSDVFDFSPDSHFYLGCVRCGAALDRHAPEFIPQHPERERLHHWSVRVSQLLIAAIDLKQIVADWCNNAVKDPDAMKTFYVDRLGLPRSASQQIDQKILDRARSFEAFDLSLTPRRPPAGTPAPLYFAGLDTGDRCWLTVREVEQQSGDQSPHSKRIVWLEQLSAERVRARVPQIFETMGITALFVDAGPLRDLARDLCFLLNGLADFRPPPLADPEHAQIHFPGGLTWDGRLGQWRGLRCAAVEFSLRQGKGIQHKLGITQDGLFYPIIACNRDETIERVVNELLTASEGVIEMITTASRDACATTAHGRDARATKLRTAPAIRLPQRTAGSPRVIETFDAHVIAGSRRERDENGNAEHFVDGCENHFLLSNAYSALAESVCEHAVAPVSGALNPDTTVTTMRARFARYGLTARRTAW
ncbi:MAG TPA: hypothetical protein VMV72_18530 [Verrucomicrobiae bacterium]|nr:hypothetical protein [Verrucomicrobiae bacterium]